jgi:hypothetical protein
MGIWNWSTGSRAMEKAMPLFFFDFDDTGNFSRDADGTEFPNRDMVRDEAIVTLALMAKESLPRGDHREFGVTVSDDHHRAVFKARLSLHAEWVK